MLEELLKLLKVIREVEDIEIKDCAIDSLIERIEDKINKDQLEKKNIRRR